MKSTVLTLLISFLVATLALAQNQIIVDNNSNGIGDHSTISAGISAAQAGDIILVIPSSQTYGNITLTKGDITIAGGGANGQLGEYTLFGTIAVSAGLKNITLGGFRSGNITVTGGATRIQDLNIQAVYVDGDVTISAVDTLKMGYVRAVNTTINNSTEMVAYHNEYATSLTINGTAEVNNNFIVSNSLFLGLTVAIDNNTAGLFNNNSFVTNLNGNTAFNFGSNSNVTNNIFSHQPNSSFFLIISGGGVFQYNVLHNWHNRYTLTSTTIGTITAEQDGNPNKNFTTTNRDFIDKTTFKLVDNSLAKDVGTGVDADGSTADLGTTGGLNPMPEDIPSVGKGVSVVPSITSLRLSLPNAASGGSVILNVTGKSKRN